jgi:ribosomal protein L24
MRIPNWLTKKSWRQGDRVVVATGKHRGKHGRVTLRAEKGNYLVLFDGDDRPTQVSKGVLDAE